MHSTVAAFIRLLFLTRAATQVGALQSARPPPSGSIQLFECVCVLSFAARRSKPAQVASQVHMHGTVSCFISGNHLKFTHPYAFRSFAV